MEIRPLSPSGTALSAMAIKERKRRRVARFPRPKERERKRDARNRKPRSLPPRKLTPHSPEWANLRGVSHHDQISSLDIAESAQLLEQRAETNVPGVRSCRRSGPRGEPWQCGTLSGLRARRERPSNCGAATRSYEFSPSDVDGHVTPPVGVMSIQWRDDTTPLSRGLRPL
jgi:hypothetical protein